MLALPQMEAILTALPYVEITLSVLLIIAVILQQRGAGLGGAFGDSFATTYYKRRGAEKFLFYSTIVLAILLVGSAIVSLLA